MPLLSEYVREQHQAMASALAHWIAAIAGAGGAGLGPEQQLGRLVLPTGNCLAAPLDLGQLVDGFPPAFLGVRDTEIASRIRQRLERLSVALFVADRRVVEGLSNLAFEYATFRTILRPEDSCEVTAAGVLAAAGLLNLLHFAHRLRQAPGRPLDSRQQRTIAWPLELAEARFASMQPGDLWILDLLARTARTAYAAEAAARAADAAEAEAAATEATAEAAAEAAAVVPPDGTPLRLLLDYVAWFTSASLLHKTIEVNAVPREIARKSRYTLWPGLEVVVAAPGAAGLRTLLVGELARRAVQDSTGYSRPVLGRFLDAILAMDDAPWRLPGRAMLASLLWECLEQDESAIQHLLERKEMAAALVKTASALHEACEADPVPGEPPLRLQLRDLRTCLRTYDAYRALEAMCPTTVAASSPEPLSAVTTSSPE